MKTFVQLTTLFIFMVCGPIAWSASLNPTNSNSGSSLGSTRNARVSLEQRVNLLSNQVKRLKQEVSMLKKGSFKRLNNHWVFEGGKGTALRIFDSGEVYINAGGVLRLTGSGVAMTSPGNIGISSSKRNVHIYGKKELVVDSGKSIHIAGPKSKSLIFHRLSPVLR